MKTKIEKLKEHTSSTPSKWKEAAVFRLENKSWLRYSRMIAMKVADRMEETGLTQQQLAERMGCSQQYISKILQGRENLSLETLCKIEAALNLKFIHFYEEYTAEEYRQVAEPSLNYNTEEGFSTPA